MEILKENIFPKQLAEISSFDWNIGFSRGNPVLEQTRKNKVKKDLQEGLAAWLNEALEGIANVYLVKEGVAIEIENDSVRTKCEEGNGFITILLDPAFQSLAYDAYDNSEDWIFEKEQKAQKAQERAAKKASKVSKTSNLD